MIILISDINIKLHCRILTKVIKEAKRLHYNRQILYSSNKMKTTWNIAKTQTAQKCSNDNIHLLNAEGNIVDVNQTIADSFNKYFSTITENIIPVNKTNNDICSNENNPINYLFHVRKQP